MEIIILYIPVLHQGYINFLHKYKTSRAVFIPCQEIIEEFNVFHKEIRQIPPVLMLNIIKKIELVEIIELLDSRKIESLQKNTIPFTIITANDSVSLGVVEKYFPKHPRKISTVFLRWDEKNVYSQKDVEYDRVSTDEFDKKMITEAETEAQKSSDWWRRVGAILLKKANQKKLIITGYNSHVPSEHIPYALGDPRDFIKAGEKSEISSTIHAEEIIFVKAIRNGISVDGTDLYTTVFPCPRCAKLIAYSGIKRLFVSSGHASLDGYEILKSQNVEIILVK